MTKHTQTKSIFSKRPCSCYYTAPTDAISEVAAAAITFEHDRTGDHHNRTFQEDDDTEND